MHHPFYCLTKAEFKANRETLGAVELCILESSESRKQAQLKSGGLYWKGQ